MIRHMLLMLGGVDGIERLPSLVSTRCCSSVFLESRLLMVDVCFSGGICFDALIQTISVVCRYHGLLYQCEKRPFDTQIISYSHDFMDQRLLKEICSTRFPLFTFYSDLKAMRDRLANIVCYPYNFMDQRPLKETH